MSCLKCTTSWISCSRISDKYTVSYWYKEISRVSADTVTKAEMCGKYERRITGCLPQLAYTRIDSCGALGMVTHDNGGCKEWIYCVF